MSWELMSYGELMSGGTNVLDSFHSPIGCWTLNPKIVFEVRRLIKFKVNFQQCVGAAQGQVGMKSQARLGGHWPLVELFPRIVEAVYSLT